MAFSSISQKITFAPEFNQIDDLGNGIKKSQKTQILEAIEKAYVKSSIAREMFDKWVITDKKMIQTDYLYDEFAASKNEKSTLKIDLNHIKNLSYINNITYPCWLTPQESLSTAA